MAIWRTSTTPAMLESDRFDEFPDFVFVRALAQSMCRSLKIDAAPVLALLPKTPGQRLDKLHGGLNAQYRDRPTQIVPDDWSGVAKPLIWGPALLVLAAAIVYFFPSDWLSPPKASPRTVSLEPAANAVEPAPAIAPAVTPAPADTAAPALATAPAVTSALPVSVKSAAALEATQETVASAPPPAAAMATPAPAPASSLASAPAAAVEKVAAPVSGVLQFRTSGNSWIEVQDARGQMLLSRGLEAGEAVGLNGALPMTVTIGNVRATQVVFRGKAMDLALFTRGNIARFELK